LGLLRKRASLPFCPLSYSLSFQFILKYPFHPHPHSSPGNSPIFPWPILGKGQIDSLP
jgi:hypothetical protein